MGQAQLVDDLYHQPRSRQTKGNLTMLHLDELSSDLMHLGIVPLEESLDLADVVSEAHDSVLEPEVHDEHVDNVLDMEGVGIDDPVRMYLREIGRVTLLTADHEVALAKRMEKGECLCNKLEELEEYYGFMPPAEIVCLELYEALVQKWSLLEEIYQAHYNEQPPTS